MKKHILATLLAASTAAQASWYDGNDLHKFFNANDAVSRGFILGFVTGIASAWDNDLFCLPANVTPGQLSDVVRSRLNRIPEQRHKGAEIIVAAALVVAYPCSDKPSTKLY